MTHTFARETLTDLIDGAPPARWRTIAMGFTANIDVLLPGGPALTARMRQWQAESSGAEAEVWRAILDAQAHCAREGRGGELALEPAAVLHRFDTYGQARTLGGTGVRAAAQAALLGQRTLVSVSAHDPLLAPFLPTHLVTLAAPSFSMGNTPLPIHYVIEMPEAPSDQEVGNGPACTRRQNRLILHGDEPLSPLIPDAFITRLLESSPPVSILLLSGFNTYTSPTLLEHALTDVALRLRGLKQAVSDLWIHLELAGFASPEPMRRVLNVLGPAVDAVGMNEDECAAALDPYRPMALMPPETQFALMRDTLTKYGLERLVVHTSWMSCLLSRTPGDLGGRAIVARALALGNTAAGFRFAQGRDGTWDDLRAAARVWSASPLGITCAAAAAGRRDLVVVPAWDIQVGLATVGLGDSFTGALLTGLDPPAKEVN
ncbi:MAG TPA: ADP-dependent glucokinase/phosphofructokinase [Chloroflexota bacterium]|nr:ADP-dependent glucokinase/phosphofructokinase [Chloroflexota bacterium]